MPTQKAKIAHNSIDFLLNLAKVNQGRLDQYFCHPEWSSFNIEYEKTSNQEPKQTTKFMPITPKPSNPKQPFMMGSTYGCPALVNLINSDKTYNNCFLKHLMHATINTVTEMGFFGRV